MHRTTAIFHPSATLSSSTSTTSNINVSMHFNSENNEKSKYDNVTNSISHSYNKNINQHFIINSYDNYPCISNHHPNPCGK